LIPSSFTADPKDPHSDFLTLHSARNIIFWFHIVDARVIAMLAGDKIDIETRAKSLIHAALDAGGKDNVTVLIAENVKGLSEEDQVGPPDSV
jgi:serine/threonine protein phosphatase PrpC